MGESFPLTDTLHMLKAHWPTTGSNNLRIRTIHLSRGICRLGGLQDMVERSKPRKSFSGEHDGLGPPPGGGRHPSRWPRIEASERLNRLEIDPHTRQAYTV